MNLDERITYRGKDNGYTDVMLETDDAHVPQPRFFGTMCPDPNGEIIFATYALTPWLDPGDSMLIRMRPSNQDATIRQLACVALTLSAQTERIRELQGESPSYIPPF